MNIFNVKLYHYQYLIHYFEIGMNGTILESYTMLLSIQNNFENDCIKWSWEL